MVVDEKWQERARRLLKAELAREGLSYKELVERLEKTGLKTSPQNIANQMSRGGFSAAFLLQCLHAIGSTDIRLDWED
jgi:hypothetical protein